MAHFTLQIDNQRGPLLKATVGVSAERSEALTKAGKAVPTGQGVDALVDTGASCSSVDPSVLQALDLTPTGNVPIYTPSGKANLDQYDVGLLIPGADATHAPLIFPTIPVVAAELKTEQGFDVLIGRDILSMCMLIYNGTQGFYTLAF